VSAGGVVFRRTDDGPEIALILVDKEKGRWQLPKGKVDEGETPEIAALRETREEAGVNAELIAPLETVDYWYVGGDRTGRVRYHKFVHFFLLEYRSGDVRDHDHEVEEARWVAMQRASSMLAFASERRVMESAVELIGNV
jgi:8-oxo-dGTP pyrophosphatase MutT (NUDIX family)